MECTAATVSCAALYFADRCMQVSPFLPSRNLRRIIASILPFVATTPSTPPLAAGSSAERGTGGGAKVRVAHAAHVLWSDGMRLSRCEALLEPSFPGVLSNQCTSMLHGSSRLRASLVFVSTRSIVVPRPRTNPPTHPSPASAPDPPTHPGVAEVLAPPTHLTRFSTPPTLWPGGPTKSQSLSYSQNKLSPLALHAAARNRLASHGG